MAFRSFPRDLPQAGTSSGIDFDVVIVGAGFAGLCLLYKLRELGLKVRVYDSAGDVGGTWYWNRFPGATTDVESVEYSYSFSEELQQEWKWSTRYAHQPEILRYARFVAEKFDLYKDIQFNTRVRSVVYDEAANQWRIQTDRGEQVSAQFCVMATGILSIPKKPDYKGIDSFRGAQYHTGRWPHEEVDFASQRVGIIGTGSTGIQCIPIIAQQASHLHVFQRTPNFSIPLRNGPMKPEYEQAVKENYGEWRRRQRNSNTGWIAVDFKPGESDTRNTLDVSHEEREQEYEYRWKSGGLCFYNSFKDMFTNAEANRQVADFVRRKIRETVHDPEVAELLIPKDYHFGTKRLCADTNYYETYNRDNVTLVDVKNSPIEEFTPDGLRVQGVEYKFDSIVFATGFDAVTGAMKSIDIRGRNGCTLNEKWASGPLTYLGLMTSGFPNLFILGGPGSAFSNYFVNIETNAEWIIKCIGEMKRRKYTRIEATAEAEKGWAELLNEVGDRTLFTSTETNTWFVSRQQGKGRSVMMYLGGVRKFIKRISVIAENGYEGFRLDRPGETESGREVLTLQRCD